MEANQKELILGGLEKFVKTAGSQNKAAAQLGIAAATVSAILNRKWDSIGESMWIGIASKIGMQRDVATGWTISRHTQTYRTIAYVLNDAQENSMAYWLTGEAGSGKTTTARDYVANHTNAFYIQCCTDMKRTHFVNAVAAAVGLKSTAHYPYEIWEDITTMLNTLEQPPLLIFDEADKLSDSVFQYFIDLYNKTYGMCGIVWMSTDSIKVRFDRGLKWSKTGYKEIYSRIGQKFNDLPAANVADVVKVCEANGVTDEKDVSEIIEQTAKSAFDMRHVKKMIHKYYKVKAAKQNKSND